MKAWVIEHRNYTKFSKLQMIKMGFIGGVFYSFIEMGKTRISTSHKGVTTYLVLFQKSKNSFIRFPKS